MADSSISMSSFLLPHDVVNDGQVESFYNELAAVAEERLNLEQRIDLSHIQKSMEFSGETLKLDQDRSLKYSSGPKGIKKRSRTLKLDCSDPIPIPKFQPLQQMEIRPMGEEKKIHAAMLPREKPIQFKNSIPLRKSKEDNGKRQRKDIEPHDEEKEKFLLQQKEIKILEEKFKKMNRVMSLRNRQLEIELERTKKEKENLFKADTQKLNNSGFNDIVSISSGSEVHYKVLVPNQKEVSQLVKKGEKNGIDKKELNLKPNKSEKKVSFIPSSNRNVRTVLRADRSDLNRPQKSKTDQDRIHVNRMQPSSNQVPHNNFRTTSTDYNCTQEGKIEYGMIKTDGIGSVKSQEEKKDNTSAYESNEYQEKIAEIEDEKLDVNTNVQSNNVQNSQNNGLSRDVLDLVREMTQQLKFMGIIQQQTIEMRNRSSDEIYGEIQYGSNQNRSARMNYPNQYGLNQNILTRMNYPDLYDSSQNRSTRMNHPDQYTSNQNMSTQINHPKKISNSFNYEGKEMSSLSEKALKISFPPEKLQEISARKMDIFRENSSCQQIFPRNLNNEEIFQEMSDSLECSEENFDLQWKILTISNLDEKSSENSYYNLENMPEESRIEHKATEISKLAEEKHQESSSSFKNSQKNSHLEQSSLENSNVEEKCKENSQEGSLLGEEVISVLNENAPVGSNDLIQALLRSDNSEVSNKKSGLGLSSEKISCIEVKEMEGSFQNSFPSIAAAQKDISPYKGNYTESSFESKLSESNFSLQSAKSADLRLDSRENEKIGFFNQSETGNWDLIEANRKKCPVEDLRYIQDIKADELVHVNLSQSKSNRSLFGSEQNPNNVSIRSALIRSKSTIDSPMSQVSSQNSNIEGIGETVMKEIQTEPQITSELGPIRGDQLIMSTMSLALMTMANCVNDIKENSENITLETQEQNRQILNAITRVNANQKFSEEKLLKKMEQSQIEFRRSQESMRRDLTMLRAKVNSANRVPRVCNPDTDSSSSTNDSSSISSYSHFLQNFQKTETSNVPISLKRISSSRLSEGQISVLSDGEIRNFEKNSNYSFEEGEYVSPGRTNYRFESNFMGGDSDIESHSSCESVLSESIPQSTSSIWSDVHQ